MTHEPIDIPTLVKILKSYYSRIAGLGDATLTTIQSQQSEDRLRVSLANEGVSYSFGHYDDGGKISFSFESLYIRDSGVITDVFPVGVYPIRLSVGENIAVAFEPRDITRIDRWKSHQLNNARFADLRKGSSFEFGGRLPYCDYYFARPGGGEFSMSIHCDSGPPMSLTDWILKLWDGRLPGIDYLD